MSISNFVAHTDWRNPGSGFPETQEFGTRAEARLLINIDRDS